MRGDLGVDLVELAGECRRAGCWLAASWLASWPASISILRAGLSSRSASALAGVGAGLLERGAALLDHRQHRLALRLEARARLVDRLGGPRHRAVDRGVHLRRRLVHPLGGRAGAALDPRDMGAEPLRGAADHLVGLAAARGERGELAFQRRRLLVGGEAGLLHRLGGGARLLLGPRQIAHQHADIDPRALAAAGVERLRLAVELGGLAGEMLGDPAEPVRRLVAEAHQPRRFLAQRGAILLEPRRDDRRARSPAPGSRGASRAPPR